MANDLEYTVRTTLGVDEIAMICRDALNEVSSNVVFEKLRTNEDPFASVDRLCFAVLATGKDGLFKNKLWGLKVQIYDESSLRQVALFVQASSWKEMAATSMGTKDFWERRDNLAKISFKKGLGQEKAEIILARLRRVDTNLISD